jgi:hypothetical protein
MLIAQEVFKHPARAWVGNSCQKWWRKGRGFDVAPQRSSNWETAPASEFTLQPEARAETKC